MENKDIKQIKLRMYAYSFDYIYNDDCYGMTDEQINNTELFIEKVQEYALKLGYTYATFTDYLRTNMEDTDSYIITDYGKPSLISGENGELVTWIIELNN